MQRLWRCMGEELCPSVTGNPNSKLGANKMVASYVASAKAGRHGTHKLTACPRLRKIATRAASFADDTRKIQSYQQTRVKPILSCLCVSLHLCGKTTTHVTPIHAFNHWCTTIWEE